MIISDGGRVWLQVPFSANNKREDKILIDLGDESKFSDDPSQQNPSQSRNFEYLVTKNLPNDRPKRFRYVIDQANISKQAQAESQRSQKNPPGLVKEIGIITKPNSFDINSKLYQAALKAYKAIQHSLREPKPIGNNFDTLA